MLRELELELDELRLLELDALWETELLETLAILELVSSSDWLWEELVSDGALQAARSIRQYTAASIMEIFFITHSSSAFCLLHVNLRFSLRCSARSRYTL